MTITWAQGPFCSDLGSCDVSRECAVRSPQFPSRICWQVEQICRANSYAGIGPKLSRLRVVRQDYKEDHKWIG